MPPSEPTGTDGGQSDASLDDATPPDAVIDAGLVDASIIDAATSDASIIDAAVSDAGVLDADIAAVDAAPPPIQERFVYLADQITDGVLEVFVTATNGAAASSHRANLPLTAGMRVRDFHVNDAGTMLLYTAKTFDLYDSTELFAVDISAVDTAGTSPGTAERLHGPLPTSGGAPSSGVGVADWVPGTNQVIFTATLESTTEHGLYLSRLDVSGWNAPIKLNASLPPGQTFADIAIAPNGSGVLYRADQDTPSVHELYWVDLSGATPGPPVRVSGPFPSGDRDVQERSFSQTGYGWSPDSSTVFYLADQTVNNVVELYVVTFLAGIPQAPQRVNGSLANGADVRRIRWSPDSQWLTYLSREGGLLSEGLYLMDMSSLPAGIAQLISSDLFPTGSVVETRPNWAPDSSGFAFHATQLETGGQTTELFYVDVSGVTPSAPIRLNGPLVNGGTVPPGGVEYETLQWATDSSLLIYASEEDLDGADEVFLVRFGSGGPEASVNISGPPPFPASDVTTSLLPISPDGSQLLFRANRDSSTHEVFLIDLSATPVGTVTQVNAPMTLGGEAHFVAAKDRNIQWSLGGGLIAYLADQAKNEDFEVFVVQANQLGTSLKASGQLAPNGDVVRFEWVR